MGRPQSTLLEPYVRIHRSYGEEYRTRPHIGGADMSLLASLTLVRTIGEDGRPNPPVERFLQDILQGSKHQSKLVSGSRVDQVIIQEWGSGTWLAVLMVNGGIQTNSSGAEEAALLLH